MTTNLLTQKVLFRFGDIWPWMFTLVLRPEKGSSEELKRVKIADGELQDTLCELWRDGFLRKGHTQTPLEQLEYSVVPKLTGSKDSRCEGFTLTAQSEQGEEFGRTFPVSSFSDIASLAAHSLVESGILTAGSTYAYEVQARRRSPEELEVAAATLSLTAKATPSIFLRQSLSPLLKTAQVMGEADDEAFSVFYTQAAYSKAEKLARQGAQSQPPVETGAVLIGWTCSCPQSGELFLVVSDALEASDATQTEFSLSYTGKTWSRIQTIMRAKQSQPENRGLRILGQCHGHNFLPAGGAPPCELCAQAKTCSRTSVFVSADDRLWSRAVFARQPWMLCHIFGLNARRENVQALYTLHQHRLVERGFHLLPSFSPQVTS